MSHTMSLTECESLKRYTEVRNSYVLELGSNFSAEDQLLVLLLTHASGEARLVLTQSA